MSFVLNRQADAPTGFDTDFITPCACPVCAGVRYDDPQGFAPPTSGTAGNGLPIFSWDQAAAQITRPNASWSGALGTAAVVSYGFRLSADSMPNGVDGFVQFNASQIEFTTMILSLWSDVANITFNRVGTGTSGPEAYTNSATMLFANYSTGAEGASAFAYYPGNASFGAVQGDVWINISLPNNATLTNGGFGPHTIAHEIGHAIGLAHPADYNSLDEEPVVYPDNAVYWQDSRAYTVMSYFGSPGVGHSLNGFAFGPQLHDIAAVQRLYGANMTTRTGDTVYGFNSNTGLTHYTITASALSPVFSIWDAGGVDTIDFSGYSTNTEIDLRQEAFSSAGPGSGGVGVAIGNVSIARGAIIENAIGGSGADLITGNTAANSLRGGFGNDTLAGGAGADSLFGEEGNDVIFWDATDNLANVQGGGGTDILVFTSGAAPTTFNLASHGFESAEGRFVVTGATYTDYYDSQWRLSHEIGQADSGASWYIDWDETNSAPYQRLNQDFNASGVLAREYGLSDNGSTWNQYFDTDGSQPYVSLLQVHTAGGVYATEHGVSDNGSTWDTYFDVDGTNPFVWVQQVRDSNGVLAQEEGLADTGTRWFTDFDETGAADFQFYENVYDAMGRLSQQEGLYDNNHTWIIDYDETDAFAWYSIRRDYDENGVLISTVETPDGP